MPLMRVQELAADREVAADDLFGQRQFIIGRHPRRRLSQDRG
jgi:hypothetical protein